MVVFTERVSLPVGWHQNAAQIRVAGKLDAKHVPDFTLIPAGIGVHGGQGLHFRSVSIQANPQPQELVGLHIVELDFNIKTGCFLRPEIDGRDIYKPPEPNSS